MGYKRGVPKKEKVRIVSSDTLYNDQKEAIFETAKNQVGPETISIYRKSIPFCFALDRQSLHAVRQDPTKTGEEARVHAILKIADRLGYLLPEPSRNPNWRPGELLYTFDQSFWFVDGIHRNATGFTAHPDARPELWRAYAVAQRLREIDVALCPRAFIIGELTRFFRDEIWFQHWIDALGRLGIEVHEEAHGLLEGDKLAFLKYYAQKQSEKFQQDRQRAIEVRKARGEIFHNSPPFGLRFTGPSGVETPKVRSEVWTKPEEWSIVREMVFRLADGRLRTAAAASSWLFSEHGIRRSSVWVADLLVPKLGTPPRPSILTGVYCGTYMEKATPCRIETADGTVSDLDITENGYRRYYREYGPGVPYPIHYTCGDDEEAIPPDIYRQACARIVRRGRPPKRQQPRPHHLVILPPRILRCWHCGWGIEERCPVQNKTNGLWSDWRCLCSGVKNHSRLHLMTREAVRALPAEQWPSHPEYATLCVSEPLWETIRTQFFESNIPLEKLFPESQHTADQAEKTLWETQKEEALRHVTAIDDKWDAGEYGDTRNEANQISYQRRKQREQARYLEAKGKLQELAEFTLSPSPGNQMLARHLANWARSTQEQQSNYDFRREVVLALVKEVILNLVTGEWEATTKVNVEGFQRLAGKAVEPEPPATDEEVLGEKPIKS